MSNFNDSHQGPLDVVPVRRPPPPRSSPFRWLLRAFLLLVLACSLALNVVVVLFLAVAAGLGSSLSEDGSGHVRERYYAGDKSAADKIAVVTVDGVLMEGMNAFAEKEIEKAARDSSVKAVVLRIDSPGGSITASDDLHHRLTELRDGNPQKKTKAKPVVVSMQSVAASGGYYIAMPAQTLLAERTTVTGSIGVYAALPNVTQLADKVGFRMEIIRDGEVKDSGSPFKEMTPHERELWQSMVDNAYLEFLHVVEQGRPNLKGKLQEDIVIDKTVPIRNPDGRTRREKHTRYRADGGIFTADDALKYGLIDQIGYLDDAIQVAKQAAGLGDEYKAVVYERPPGILGILLGTKSQPPAVQFDASSLSRAAVPRLWYLSSQSELAGIFAAASGN
jgi:protease-4